MSGGRDVMNGGTSPLSLDEVLTALKQSLLETEGFHTTAGEIDMDVTLLEGGLDLDSIAIVELISRIEAHYGFQFADTDLRTRSFSSLRALAKVVLHRLSAKTAA